MNSAQELAAVLGALGFEPRDDDGVSRFHPAGRPPRRHHRPQAIVADSPFAVLRRYQ